jgi:hypothetical protein
VLYIVGNHIAVWVANFQSHTVAERNAIVLDFRSFKLEFGRHNLICIPNTAMELLNGKLKINYETEFFLLAAVYE